jgi:hypothetical protein
MKRRACWKRFYRESGSGQSQARAEGRGGHLAWIIVGCVIVTVAVIVYALWGKGDVTASMSIGKILDFKLDAKEKRGPSSESPHK